MKIDEIVVEKLAEWISISEYVENVYPEISAWYSSIVNKEKRSKRPPLPNHEKDGKEYWEELKKCKDVPHHGDCIQAPTPCLRCSYDYYIDRAKDEFNGCSQND